MLRRQRRCCDLRQRSPFVVRKQTGRAEPSRLRLELSGRVENRYDESPQKRGRSRLFLHARIELLLSFSSVQRETSDPVQKAGKTDEKSSKGNGRAGTWGGRGGG